MKRLVLSAPLLSACFVVLACSRSSAPASAPPACQASLGADPAFDLVLAGSGGCATTLRLALRIATGSPGAPTWNDVASAPLRVGGSWRQLADGSVARDVTVTNASAQPVTLVGLEWSTSSDGVGLTVDRLLHDGYQSWNYTGIEAIPGSIADALGTAPHGGDDENPLGEIVGVSWWWTALSDATGAGVVAGADGGTVLKTYLAADGTSPTRLRIVQGVTGDAVTIAPGASRTLDGLFVALGDVRTNLDAYAAHVASLHPAAAPRARPAGGWGSWNMYYAGITADTLRQEEAWAASSLGPLGLKDFLLDDGYEPHWGVWTASSAFGADLATIASEESAAGLSPAIWLAPLYVASDDPLVTQHPDWFVHASDGSLRTYNNFGPNYAALDASSDGARGYVTQAVQQLRSWGFRTLKIDFLFGGALEGTRQSALTSLESYALWMKTLRAAVPDARLIGCGAPMLPSIGWVDAMRVGPDIAYVMSPQPRWTFLEAEARHTAVRAVTDAWWALDPDVVLLRGTAIDDDEAWTAVVSGAMSGGDYLLGDARQSTPLRQAMALAPDVLAMTRDGIAARPLDLTGETDPKLFPSPMFQGGSETAVPHVWRKTSADGAHGWIAVFAWGVDDFSTQVDLPDGAQEILPPTGSSGIARSPSGGTRTIAVPLHATRLFAW